MINGQHRFKQQNPESELRLTVRPKEAAKALSISIRTLFDLLKDGKIKSFKDKRAVFIPIAGLEDFVNQRVQADDLEKTPVLRKTPGLNESEA